jgi:hypothetical protein
MVFNMTTNIVGPFNSLAWNDYPLNGLGGNQYLYFREFETLGPMHTAIGGDADGAVEWVWLKTLQPAYVPGQTGGAPVLLTRYKQQPTESSLRDIYASRWLVDGEAVIGVTTSIERLAGPDPEVVPLTCSTTIVSAGLTVKHLVGGGDDDSEYKVSFIMTTNLRVRQDEIIFVIKED